jgi:hypothetical protein
MNSFVNLEGVPCWLHYLTVGEGKSKGVEQTAMAQRGSRGMALLFH